MGSESEKPKIHTFIFDRDHILALSHFLNEEEVDNQFRLIGDSVEALITPYADAGVMLPLVSAEVQSFLKAPENNPVFLLMGSINKGPHTVWGFARLRKWTGEGTDGSPEWLEFCSWVTDPVYRGGMKQAGVNGHTLLKAAVEYSRKNFPHSRIAAIVNPRIDQIMQEQFGVPYSSRSIFSRVGANPLPDYPAAIEKLLAATEQKEVYELTNCRV